MKRTVFAAVFTLAATATFAGNSYRFQTTMTGASQEQAMSGAVEAENGKMRTTFTKGDGMLFTDNSFALSSDGRTFKVYDPSAKTYYELSPEQLSGGTAAMLDQLRQTFQLTISNAKVASRPLGDGGTIEGFPTKHTAVDASYDVNIEAMGQKMTMSTSSIIESWTTDKLPSTLSNIVQMRGFHTGLPELDKLLQAQAAAMTGFPLKQVIRTHVTQNGTNIDMTQTTTVTDVATKPIPASEFAAPQGYTKVENPLDKMLASMKKQ
jgi:hypothetical protein